MRVRVIYNYYDRELGFEKKIGDEIEVSDERGQTLIAAEVAEEIIGEQKEESSEEQPKELQEQRNRSGDTEENGKQGDTHKMERSNSNYAT